MVPGAKKHILVAHSYYRTLFAFDNVGAIAVYDYQRYHVFRINPAHIGKEGRGIDFDDDGPEVAAFPDEHVSGIAAFRFQLIEARRKGADGRDILHQIGNVREGVVAHQSPGVVGDQGKVGADADMTVLVVGDGAAEGDSCRELHSLAHYDAADVRLVGKSASHGGVVSYIAVIARNRAGSDDGKYYYS